ncbi:hypothetical protein N7454_009456 [Penicillium verhagenii]|nr:hypothetical protein N7454_009456 [Penicillium verhagenii]
MSDSPATKCRKCGTISSNETPLKRCSRCHSAYYCSQDCQKADWKTHKMACTSKPETQARASTSTSARPDRNQTATNSTNALDVDIAKPFHQIHAKKCLHGRSETDVYKLLVDSYRLRVEYDAKFGGIFDEDGIYGKSKDLRKGFKWFLTKVESQRDLLPEWWTDDKTDKCVTFGMTDSTWRLESAVEKNELIKLYGSSSMPMQLRMFSEQIYGCASGGLPSGRSGLSYLSMKMDMESGHLRIQAQPPWSSILSEILNDDA